MTVSKIVLLSFFGFISLGAMSAESGWSANQSKIVKEAQAVLLPFKKNLKATLSESVKKNGLVAAVSTCRLEAPRLLGVELQKGVSIGRTSHKLRSEANAPRAWIKPLLLKYAGTKKGVRPSHELVALSDDRFGYIEPLYVKGVCLKCHGTNVSPEINSIIAKSYPKDEAIGFSEGEFRGFFWVEINASRK